MTVFAGTSSLMRRLSVGIGLVLAACVCAWADEEAGNLAVVRVDRWGQCYAKSVPSETYGSRGTTRIYSVRSNEDSLSGTFDWYASEIYLACDVRGLDGQVGISVVQFGPWARGHKADANQMAVAFYHRGRLVKRYSTLDIAGSPDNVSLSVSHYTVIERVPGYREQGSNLYTFEVVTHDGRLIVFDPATGSILPTAGHSR